MFNAEEVICDGFKVQNLMDKESSDKSRLYNITAPENFDFECELLLKQGLDQQGIKEIHNEIAIYPKILENNFLKKYSPRYVKAYRNKNYIVTEKFNSRHLGSAIFHREVSFDQKIHVCVQLLDYIHHLSAINICHRDIRLSNIVLNNKDGIIKIIDYGQAMMIDQTDKSKCSSANYRPINSALKRGFTEIQSLEQVIYNVFKIVCGKCPWKENASKSELTNSKIEFWKWAIETEKKCAQFDNIEYSKKMKPVFALVANLIISPNNETHIPDSLYLKLIVKLVGQTVQNFTVSKRLSILFQKSEYIGLRVNYIIYTEWSTYVQQCGSTYAILRMRIGKTLILKYCKAWRYLFHLHRLVMWRLLILQFFI
ncbi:MAG: protein kinase [Colwellia sp.]|nr:protein kinase [Colwellia sp.]